MKKRIISVFVFLLCFTTLISGVSANEETNKKLTEVEINKVLAEEGIEKIKVTKKEEKTFLKDLEKNELFTSKFSSKHVLLDAKSATFDRVSMNLDSFGEDLFIVKANLKKDSNISVYALYEYNGAVLKSFYLSEKKGEEIHLTVYGHDGSVVKQMVTNEEEIKTQDVERQQQLSDHILSYQNPSEDTGGSFTTQGFWRSFFCSIYVGTGGIATCIGLGFATAGTAGVVCALIIGAGYGAVIC